MDRTIRGQPNRLVILPLQLTEDNFLYLSQSWVWDSHVQKFCPIVWNSTSPNPAKAARWSPIGTKTATSTILISPYDSSSRREGSTGQTLSSTGIPRPSGLRPHSEPAHVTHDNASADTTSSGWDPSQSPSHLPRKRSPAEIYCD